MIRQVEAVDRCPAVDEALDETNLVRIREDVVDLVVDNQHADTVYAATSGGGIWKSTDAGVNYFPAWPTWSEASVANWAAGPS